jgi:hypothetical protein
MAEKIYSEDFCKHWDNRPFHLTEYSNKDLAYDYYLKGKEDASNRLEKLGYKEPVSQGGAVAEEIDKLKNLIEELYMFHEDPSPNHRCSDEFSAFLKSQIEKRNIIENANKKNNSEAAEDDDLPF